MSSDFDGVMLILGFVAVLLFGGRLPSVARSMGKSLTEFKRGMQDIQNEVSDAMHAEPKSEVGYDDDYTPSAPLFAPPTAPPHTAAD